MGQVIAFSQLPEYLERLKAVSPTGTRATILDTNVLITSGYEVREEHERIIVSFRELIRIGSVKAAELAKRVLKYEV